MKALRKIEGATPSQRKEFRAMERHRLEQMEKIKQEGSGPVGMAKATDDISKSSIASRIDSRLIFRLILL